MRITSQIVKYICVGLVGNALVLGIYYTVTMGIGIWPGFAFPFASAVGLLMSYNMQRLWAFQYNNRDLRSLLRYCVGYLASFLVQWMILLVGVELLGLPHQWIVLFGLGMATVGFFWLQRYWVFAPRKILDDTSTEIGN